MELLLARALSAPKLGPNWILLFHVDSLPALRFLAARRDSGSNESKIELNQVDLHLLAVLAQC